ncbi:hypothetical protein [Gimesia sp.]|uniref:hypothetical protein n=1 Tax=Gimesia sp. TaxID=2024833 RepID=UPI000C6BF612|nr:hypothetical protein [Gimesia sp.]MAX38183.1 hypothetical protein [Gimesia sp.]HAH44405.1 hypothetical protein [Planctomycetaceae bacterium]HBL47893.1 hypothetical protein [Planctomycetaceae bacterium]|tara:strand:+ start:24095 stop:25069 length:975 start_codon:yes stop_codon:yes gene_type:complete
MKTIATLITCFTVSLMLGSGNASAGNNRFSGKSGKSSSSRSFNHHGNRNGNSRSNNFSHRPSNSQQNKQSSNQRFSQLKKSSTGQNNYKTSFSSKTNNYHFKPAPKQNEFDKPNRFESKKQKFSQNKATRRPIITPQKTIKHSKFHGHHHGHHNNHHGHHHWHRPWIHINTRPWCPPVCRPWYPVACADPILTPCVITACTPIYYNEAGETVVESASETETEIATEPVEQERLELVSGKLFQLSAEGLGAEQGMVVLEINEMGLPAKIETWEDNILAFQTPQIGLSKATEAKIHVMNSKGQLLATLDINLQPATEKITDPVASN